MQVVTYSSVDMIKTPKAPRSHCPINFGLEIFGDKWTLLILRDLLIAGKKSFKEFQQSEEQIASNILSERLSRLEQSGIITHQTGSPDKRQVHYLPTKEGGKLLTILVEMAYWGATHDRLTAAPDSFIKAYESDRTRLLESLMNGGDPSKRK